MKSMRMESFNAKAQRLGRKGGGGESFFKKILLFLAFAFLTFATFAPLR